MVWICSTSQEKISNYRESTWHQISFQFIIFLSSDGKIAQMVIISTHCSFVLQFGNKVLFPCSFCSTIRGLIKKRKKLWISVLIKFQKYPHTKKKKLLNDWRFFMKILFFFYSSSFKPSREEKKFRCFIMNRNFLIFRVKKLPVFYVFLLFMSDF